MADAVTMLALPAGIAADGRLRVNLLVVPRLESAGSLAATVFADWPARLAEARLALRIDDETSDIVMPIADSALWQQMFPADLPVRGAAPEAMTSLFVTYDAQRMAGAVETMRADAVAGDGNAMRTLRAALSGRKMEAALISDGAAMRRSAEARLAADRRDGRPGFRTLRDGDDDEIGAIADFALFHADEPVGVGQLNDAPPPSLDFHQRLALAADHPELLRRLGIIIEVLAPADNVVPGLRALAIEGVLPGGLDLVAPKTAARLGANRFVTAARDGPDAMLAFGGRHRDRPRFRLIDYDLDAAGEQLVNLLRDTANTSEDDVAAPSRTIGISILEHDRARTVHDAADASLAGAGKADTLLNAEDVARGIRIDVREDSSGRWASLHARAILYHGPGGDFESIDEGTLVPALAQKVRSQQAVSQAAHDPDAAAFVGEQLALWNGWSLSAPRPQRTTRRQFVRGGLLDHEISVVPGSLPRLRFGSSYRFRARRVDLAGHSLGIDAVDPAVDGTDLVLPSETEAAWRFLRHEPIAPPQATGSAPTDMLVLRDGAGEADSMMLLGPPQVSPLLAEWCGRLDAAFGPDGDAAAVAGIAARLQLPDPHAAAVAIIGCPDIAAGEIAEFAGSVLMRREGPDPGARGVLLIPFAGAWPDLTGFTLAIDTEQESPRWEPDARRLRIGVPPGAEVMVELATAPGADAVPLLADLLGQPQLNARAVVGLLPALTPRRRLKLVHALELPVAPELAVLPAPVRTMDSPSGWIGANIRFDPATTAGLSLEARWQDADDLLSEGDETPETMAVLFDLSLGVDAALPPGVSRPEPGLLRLGQPDLAGIHAAIAVRVAAVSAANANVNVVARQTGFPRDMLADVVGPLLRALAFRPVDAAWPRIAEAAREFAAMATILGSDTPADGPPGQLEMPLELIGALRFAASQADAVADSAQRASDFVGSRMPAWSFGDGRARQLDILPIATSRFAAHYGIDAVTERSGPPMRVLLPASARPRPPKLVDIVPIFFWSRVTSLDGEYDAERISGLRLVLERPWLSSGPGEMLGVLFGGSQVITRWGRDPLLGSVALPKRPTLEQARGAARSFAALRLPPFDTANVVSVAGYPVTLDAAGRAIADVIIDPGASYSPFVSLAIARLQPDAIEGMELSEPLQLDPIQLPPNRKLTVVKSNRIDLRLDGPANPGTTDAADPLGRVPNQVRVRFEQQIPGAVGDVGWNDASEFGTAAGVQPNGALWRGIADQRVETARPLRLRVEEVEIWPADGPAGATSERLVFAETIPID